jgi:hypothetical protein
MRAKGPLSHYPAVDLLGLDPLLLRRSEAKLAGVSGVFRRYLRRTTPLEPPGLDTSRDRAHVTFRE